MSSPYTEYPRGPGAGMGGPMRGTPRGAVDLAAIGEAFELMKANWTPFALATVIAGIAYYAIVFVVSLPFAVSAAVLQSKVEDPTAILMAQLPGTIVQSAVGSVLMGIILGGMANMTLALLRGETVTVNHFFKVIPKAHLFMAYGFLYTVLTYLGLIGCFVGSIVVAGLLMTSPLFMVDKEMGPVDAIKASFNALKGEWLMATVFYFVASLVAGIGLLACGVGVLFTAPLAALAIAIVYRDVTYVGMQYAPAAPTAPGPAPSEAPMSPPPAEEPPSPPAEG